jgi:hypothetical protein
VSGVSIDAVTKKKYIDDDAESPKAKAALVGSVDFGLWN